LALGHAIGVHGKERERELGLDMEASRLVLGASRFRAHALVLGQREKGGL
jgi:hypothetical protein